MYKLIICSIIIFFGSCSTTNTENPSYSENVQPIFTQSCALSGCHATKIAANRNLVLTSEASYNAIVNVPSTEVPEYDLVQPGDAENSYLYMKIVADPRITGVEMPKTGSITRAQIETIAAWINQGALNN